MLRLILSALLLLAAPPALAREEPPQGADWPFAESDLPVDPDFRFDSLENGMRFIIRHNATPAGQAMVQLWIDAGSIDEADDELGYAHFVEHMAFNGSARVPEGEMIKLLEREGLAFGADTNATTGFEQTIYKLDLPRNDPALLDTALMLLRETASELTFAPEAVEREKGVVLAELRVRDTYAWRNTVDQFHFLYPDARFSQRFPVGTAEALQGATSEGLRAFWQRHYRPARSAVVVVGDFDPALVEASIRAHFSSWQAAEAVAEPDPGPVASDHAGATDIFLDPAMPERIHIARNGPAIDEPDTIASRQRKLLAQIGYQAVNRRLQRLARQDDPPFRSAGIGTSEVFDIARTSNLVVDAGDGEWAEALAAAQLEMRRALEFGLAEAELREQVANLRTSLEDAAAGAQTRSNASLVNAAIALLDEEQVPTTPQSTLARFETFVPQITPAAVLAALKQDMLPLDNPLIRFSGRTAPDGGAAVLREAWYRGMQVALPENSQAEPGSFAYTDFGPPGAVASDAVEPRFGIRQVTFANGLRLNLKRTELEEDKVQVRLNVDGGQLLATVDNPLATSMASLLYLGGLGKHKQDELQSILAGHRVGFDIATNEDTFGISAATTPRDLLLQLQLFAAVLSDAGYHPEGEAQHRRNIENFFARMNASPEGAFGNNIGRIVSGNDPRFTVQPREDYLALTFAGLREAIDNRLKHGAAELAIVGDFDEQAAIDAVAATLGALSPRESEPGAYPDSRKRSFAQDRGLQVLLHGGNRNQARLGMIWPTTDDSALVEQQRLELLERVVRLELTERLREELGHVYSPTVRSEQSHAYPGFGTFTVAASIDSAVLTAARDAMLETIARLGAQPVSDDVLLRARKPLLEAYDNALKTNSGWANLVQRSGSEPERLTRFHEGRAVLEALTAADIQATAARYLQPDARLEVHVLSRKE